MSIDKDSIFAVVLSGGTGSRLWPASREDHPKPFIKLADGQTLINKTYERVKALSSCVLTVTNRDYYFMSRDEKELAGLAGSFLLEPFARNTAPAVALAAKLIESREGPDSLILVLPADHLIVDQSRFASKVLEASKLAARGYLVTFGIVPTAPESGFGYIELGDTLDIGNKVVRFVEKPNQETAQGYVSSGKYLWNSGMFCFKAGVFLAELAKHAPDVAKVVDACWAAMQPICDDRVIEISATNFKSAPDVSIDCAVIEKSDMVAVVPGDFGWSDIGSWNAIRDLVEPDAKNNRALGKAIFVDSTNNFVQSEDRLVATVGVNDLIIIDTADALLVAHSDKSQEVKKVVNALKKDCNDVFKVHRTVTRPWGTYTVLQEAPGFKIKRIEVKPGACLSLQMHRHRSEHWVVVKGSAKITNGDEKVVIAANQSTYIPAGQKHRLENPGLETCVMIEVQCGLYLGEDDIIRYDDQYGR